MCTEETEGKRWKSMGRKSSPVVASAGDDLLECESAGVGVAGVGDPLEPAGQVKVFEVVAATI